MKRSILYIWLALVFLGSCTVTESTKQESVNLASLYNPSEYSLNLGYQVYHISDQLTSLYVRIFPGELLFNMANPERELRAEVLVSYLLYELDDEDQIMALVDSSEFKVLLLKEDRENTAHFTARVMQIPAGKRYLIRLDAKDMHRGSVGLNHLFIDKKDVYSAQNFSVLSPRTRYPKFQHYFSTGELFKLDYRVLGLDTLYMDYYSEDYVFPRPRMEVNAPSYYNRIADTTIVFAYTDTTYFALPEKGMYHFRADTLHPGGISIHNFGGGYPQVKTVEDLLGPIFYIATQSEYQALTRSDNLKLAIDDFWIDRASSLPRSKELIRVYYNRVLYSNLYFTADREGWKTDRGMVFILFGPPDRMRDSGSDQRWYYISRRQGKVIEFVFERKSSQFTNSDLIWKKNMESMQYVSSAVSSWRSGKVFSLSR